jgi:hypothetical protein
MHYLKLSTYAAVILALASPAVAQDAAKLKKSDIVGSWVLSSIANVTRTGDV